MSSIKKAAPFALCIALFLCAPVFGAAGGTIEAVAVEKGTPTRVTVTAVFPDNCSMDAQAITTVLAQRVIVQVFTGEPADPCDAGPLTITRDYTPPAGEAYELLVLLYDGIPFGSPVTLLDNETMRITPETDACGALCREAYDQCRETCDDVLLECRSACDNDDECLEVCDEDFTECAETCTEAFDDCKESCNPGGTLVINPKTVNLRAQGRWITAYLMPPAGFVTGDIDMASVRLEQQIEPDWYVVQSDSIMMKFSRQAVADYIRETYNAFPADIDLSISGLLLDADATPFSATDTIRFINPGRGNMR